MAELADAQDSDSCPSIGGAGSSPVIRSRKTLDFSRVFLYIFIWKYLQIYLLRHYYDKKIIMLFPLIFLKCQFRYVRKFRLSFQYLYVPLFFVLYKCLHLDDEGMFHKCDEVRAEII